jgi:hypothetical protein
VTVVDITNEYRLARHVYTFHMLPNLSSCALYLTDGKELTEVVVCQVVLRTCFNYQLDAQFHYSVIYVLH